MLPISLYIHFPFCVAKCAYCDFNSMVAPDQLRRRYLAALQVELRRLGANCSDRLVTTVYLGGGTPTIYSAEELCRVLGLVRQLFKVSREAEISVEANPGTVTAAGLALMREMGFNRLSLGVQSFLDEELHLLGRCHSAAQARRAVAQARAAGFENLSLDLINALPGQSAGAWQASLREALGLQPEHLSCYGLSIEDETPLGALVREGKLQRLDEDAAAEIYEFTHTTCTAAGYEHYEIANFARPGCRCRHNLNYWRNGEYLGVGAGAWSYLNRERCRHESDPARYVELVEGEEDSVMERERLNNHQRAGETLMLALRTAEGVDLAQFCRQFHMAPQRFDLRLKALTESGLALPVPGRLALHPVRGFLLQSEIAAMFL